jgi:hypothetical protein
MSSIEVLVGGGPEDNVAHVLQVVFFHTTANAERVSHPETTWKEGIRLHISAVSKRESS